ncbi:SDR family NAD(P)-dependent oxidoreductase [Streptomyces hygroscopicus]|uniref:SDR family NAD(P)-dependent oxidoreductase n=1 Tax=Streptomyces hygroscopicus TaxID=1912 RepID=UPI003645D9E5
MQAARHQQPRAGGQGAGARTCLSKAYVPITATSREAWDTILDVNLTGQFLGMQACAPLMERTGGGSIINIGSTAGIMGHPVAAYSSSKWGVRGMTKSAAIDLAAKGIRVNAMHPGVVDTPMMDSGSTLFKSLVSMTALGRAADADEMASAALFLASDDSSFVTGIDLPVDGGFSELAAMVRSGTESTADHHRFLTSIFHEGPSSCRRALTLVRAGNSVNEQTGCTTAAPGRRRVHSSGRRGAA